MVFKLIIKSKANTDLKIALDWYKLQNDELPKKLFIRMNETLNKIQENPFHFQKKYKEVRIAFTVKFPYGVYFSVENQTIIIHAILHNKQNPKIAIERAT